MLRSDKYHRFQSFKVLFHADRIRRIINNDIPTPTQWIIYPTNACSYNCAHCIMAKEKECHKASLSGPAMARIPEDAKRHRIKTVIFSGGGDPLLNPFTVKTAMELKDVGVKVGLNSQGYYLDDPAAFDFVRFSVDAATEETYCKIHRPSQSDAWMRVNRNIETCARYKRHNPNFEFGLAFLVTPENWTEAQEFCRWGQQFDPDFIHVRPAFLDADYLDRDGGRRLKDEIAPKLVEMAHQAEETFRNVYFRFDKFNGFWTEKAYSKCRANALMAVTSADGSFIVCQDRGILPTENHLRWGDYNRENFSQIWWSEEHKKVMEAIDLDKCPRCVECGYNEIIEKCFMRDDLRIGIL